MVEKVKRTNYFDSCKLGRHQKFFMVIAGLTYAFDLMDVSIFSIVAPILQANYGITNEKLASLNFLFFIGAFLGSTLGGYIADKVGRKKAMLLNIMVFSLASLANALWQPGHFMVLELSRFFTGFGTMAAVAVAITYISEMLPSEKRGKYQSMILGLGTFSIPFIAVVASGIATQGVESWRIVLGIGALMLVLVPFAVLFLVESPRWLVSKGRLDDAEKALEKCLGFACDLSEAQANYQRSVANYHKISFSAQMKIIFSKEQIKQTLVCVAFAWFLGCGNNLLTSYNNAFLVQIGFPLQMVLLVGAIAAFGQPIGELLSALVTDKGGRTKPMAIYCICAAILFVAIGFAKDVVTWGILNFIKTLFTSGTIAMLMTYLPESFPTSVRGSATGYVYGTQRIVLAFVSSLFPVVMFTNFGWLGVNIFNGVFFLIAGLLILIFGKPTAMKSIDFVERNE